MAIIIELAAPCAVVVSAETEDAYITPLEVNGVAPPKLVPPLAVGKVPVTSAVKDTALQVGALPAPP